MKEYNRMIPDEWNKMKKFHLMMYCKLLDLQLQPENLTYALAFRFMKMPMWAFEKLKAYQYDVIKKKLEFLSSEECTLTNFPIDFFWLRGKKYYSPGDNLKFSTVEEVAEADSAFQKYIASKEDADLCKMIAVLYRPKSLGGVFRKIFSGKDLREKFSSYRLARRANKFKRLPSWLKQAVLFEFTGCRTMNVKNNPELYSGGGENVFGWAGTIISLAGPEIGTIDDVAQMLWNNALVYMKKSEYDRQKIENEFKQKQQDAQSENQK